PLAPLLDDVLLTAHRLLASSGAALRMGNPDLSRAVRPIGMSEPLVDSVARAHVDASERARTARRPVECTHDGEALLVAPGEAAGRAVGEMLVLRPEPFSESDIRLVEALALQAGVASENARAERSARRMRTGYRLLADLGTKLSASQSRDAILDVLARRAHELV